MYIIIYIIYVSQTVDTCDHVPLAEAVSQSHYYVCLVNRVLILYGKLARNMYKNKCKLWQCSCSVKRLDVKNVVTATTCTHNTCMYSVIGVL